VNGVDLVYVNARIGSVASTKKGPRNLKLDEPDRTNSISQELLLREKMMPSTNLKRKIWDNGPTVGVNDP